MKALQDKLKNSENQNEELQKQISTFERSKKEALDDQRKKFESELQASRDRENGLQSQVHKLTQDIAIQKDQITRFEKDRKEHNDEYTDLKLQISKFRDEIAQLHQEKCVLEKEIKIIEAEKASHLEQNAVDRDNYENKIDELENQINSMQDKFRQFENEKNEFVNQKVDAESELDKVRLETVWL